MNKSNVFFVSVAVALSLIPVGQSHANRADHRQKAQQQRIEHGLKTGELTHGEAKRLQQQQQRIQRAETRAKSDGVFTDKEKARLENLQDRASKTIHRAKHNDLDRNGTAPQGAPSNENSGQ